MTKFIRRDGNGNINGAYTCRQDFATEELADDHPDLLAYMNPPPDPRAMLDEQEAAADKIDAQVQNFLNKSPAERASWINANINNAANLADLKAGCVVAFSVLGALAANAARGRKLR